EDMRRQMDVNYWGQVHGSRTAVRMMSGQGGGIAGGLVTALALAASARRLHRRRPESDLGV
ncbi:MAG: hypothetical protein ACRD1Q_06885, partial [Vicinamibacterales bacterium]